MLRITDISVPLDHDDSDVLRKARKLLKIHADDVVRLEIARRSVDARKKDAIAFIYTVDVELRDEAAVLKRVRKDRRVSQAPDLSYHAPTPVSESDRPRPVIIGAGPCGLFCALVLAEAGRRPLLLERGKRVDERVRDVYAFWSTGALNSSSNVAFGEGGAGTFSDGKLTTQIKDRGNRVRKVLEELVAAGAPREILYANKPHIGTDVLVEVVRGLRERIVALGGEVRFEAQVTDIVVQGGAVVGVTINGGESIAADCAVLAVGHSARDTFATLLQRGVALEPKPFSIGARIEHPQRLIDVAQYGASAGHPRLGAADYKLVHHCRTGRAAYTFCMCPGGQVIGASSEPDGVVTNGMSVARRDLPNANSGLLVGVFPADFGDDHPLAGVEFQRRWERLAFEAGGGDYRAPAQLVGDFLAARASQSLGEVQPSYAPGVTLTDLGSCLPEYVIDTLREALPELDRKLKGFARPDAVLTGVETRSSSPVRIVRDESLQSVAVRGLYPAGEGAGYAGGIVSAAVDGLRVAEAVAAL